MMRTLLSILSVLIILPSIVSATDYYVDPDVSSGGDGSQANPWTSLGSSQWNTINNALASDDVTVYFSALEQDGASQEKANYERPFKV
jgi:hypothetical protein